MTSWSKIIWLLCENTFLPQEPVLTVLMIVNSSYCVSGRYMSFISEKQHFPPKHLRKSNKKQVDKCPFMRHNALYRSYLTFFTFEPFQPTFRPVDYNHFDIKGKGNFILPFIERYISAVFTMPDIKWHIEKVICTFSLFEKLNISNHKPLNLSQVKQRGRRGLYKQWSRGFWCSGAGVGDVLLVAMQNM